MNNKLLFMDFCFILGTVQCADNSEMTSSDVLITMTIVGIVRDFCKAAVASLLIGIDG